jgi:hypothetical protein
MRLKLPHRPVSNFCTSTRYYFPRYYGKGKQIVVKCAADLRSRCNTAKGTLLFERIPEEPVVFVLLLSR